MNSSCSAYDGATPSVDVAREVIAEMQLSEAAVSDLSRPRVVLRVQSLFSREIQAVLQRRQVLEETIQEHRRAYAEDKRMGGYKPEQGNVRKALVDLLGEPDKASV